VNVAVIDARTARRRRIGRNVKTARDDAGFTQLEFAPLVGVTQAHLSKWETGRHRPSDDYLERIAALTGRTFGWFLDHREPGDPYEEGSPE
jgi:transcriptional regulator with XRE-family HTH domain